MRKQRALVAGGAGFVGSHLCERLLADGYDVLCVDNLVTGRLENISGFAESRGFDFLERDVTEAIPVSGPVDVVFNLASPASPGAYLRLPVETLLAGALGSLHTLELAKATGARYIFSSTSEVYGDPQVHPQPESYWGNVNPVGPRAVYDEAKRYAEALITTYREHRGVAATIVRIFNTYGPRMHGADGRAVPTFVRQALSGQPLTVTRPGTQTRSMCFVDDLVEALVRLAGQYVPGPMNLGNPAEITVSDLAGLIVDLCGSTSRIEFVEAPQDDPMRRCPDITHARATLGWQPEIDLVDGLRRTIAWFRGDVVDGARVAGSRAGLRPGRRVTRLGS